MEATKLRANGFVDKREAARLQEIKNWFMQHGRRFGEKNGNRKDAASFSDAAFLK